MGYQTAYSLEIVPADEDLLDQILDDEDLREVIEESCKWYEHEKDMLKVSEKYPDLVFHLHGEGEENDDIWKKDFWNGHMQVRAAEIKFPYFDPSFGGVHK